MLGAQDAFAGFQQRVGRQRDRIDPLLDEEGGELGEIARRLAADAHLAAFAVGRLDDVRAGLQHGGIALVEERRDQRAVPVHAENELRQIVGPDGEAVEDACVLIGEEDVGRQFRHHVHFQPVAPLHEAALAQDLDDLAPFVGSPAERHHQFEVREPELLAHPLHRAQFEHEAFLVLGVVIARGAAPAEHGVFFRRLELPSAQERGVLVRLEIGEPQDDRLGMEGGRDGADALRELVDEVFGLVLVAARDGVDRLSRRIVELRISRQRQRVHLHPAGEDELHARQAHTVVGQHGGGEGLLGIADVEHHLRARARELAAIHFLHIVLQGAAVDAALLALGAAERDRLAVGNARRRLARARAHHRGDSQLARHDGRVRGAAAALGDDAGGHLHDRLPVGIGIFRDENFAALELGELRRAADDARLAHRDALPHGQALHELFALAGQLVDAQRSFLRVGVHRLGPRLQHEQLAGLAVLAPLDVHG